MEIKFGVTTQKMVKINNILKSFFFLKKNTLTHFEIEALNMPILNWIWEFSTTKKIRNPWLISFKNPSEQLLNSIKNYLLKKVFKKHHTKFALLKPFLYLFGVGWLVGWMVGWFVGWLDWNVLFKYFPGYILDIVDMRYKADIWGYVWGQKF